MEVHLIKKTPPTWAIYQVNLPPSRAMHPPKNYIKYFPAVEQIGLLETETILLGGLGDNKFFRSFSWLLTTCNIILLQ